MMTANLFVIANVKQLWTDGSFRILLPFFQTSWGVGALNSVVFNSFHNRGWVWHDFGGPSEFFFGGGGCWAPSTPFGMPLSTSDTFCERTASQSDVPNCLQHRGYLACMLNDEVRGICVHCECCNNGESLAVASYWHGEKQKNAARVG